MTSARDLVIFTGAPASGSRGRVAPVEKSNPSNAPEQAPRPADPDSRHNFNARNRPTASRFETDSRTPFWYGPRLRPAFVAQVLGQVFARTVVPSSPTYRAESIPMGLLVNQKI